MPVSHFIECIKDDGRKAVIRADAILAVVEDLYRPKEGPPAPCLMILMGNHVVLKVIDIDRERFISLMRTATPAGHINIYEA